MPRVPPPKEAQTQSALVEALGKALKPGWKFFHVGNGEKRDIRTALKLRAMGVSRGVPDLVFVGPREMFFLELKRHSGAAMSREQLNWRDHIMRCGFRHLVTNDLQDAFDELHAAGVISRIEVQA